MTGWTVLGVVGFGLVTGVAVSMQLLQEEIKPVVLVTHVGVTGGVAGALVGYRTATLTETEAEVGKLERSNEQLQQFAYVASHDLKEPLRMVSSYMDLLAEEYGDELNAEGEAYIDHAIDGTARMERMIEGLLEYSRVTTDGRPFEPIDATRVCEDALRDLEMLIEESDATVAVGDLPRLRADPEQLRSVFPNW